MATKKSKKKVTITAHDRAILAAAKKRGLIKIDLRKPISRYARGKIKDFEAVYNGQAAVVSVPRSDRGAFAGLKSARGKLIVPKQSLDETIRYSKKTKKITASRGGKTREISAGKLRLTYRFKVGAGRERVRRWVGGDAWAYASKFMAHYNDENWEENMEVDYV